MFTEILRRGRGRPKGPTAQGEAAKDLLYATAKQLIAKQGYEATTLRQIAVEAGVSGLWYKYVGLNGAVVGIDRFGISAPGGTVMKELGMTADHVAAVAKTLL